MAGAGKGADLQPPYSIPLPEIKIWEPKGKEWVPLSAGARFGPEVSFGHAMAKAFPDDDIRLVKHAVSGTSLYKDWAPTNGPQYRAFMATANDALADLDTSNVAYSVVGMLWLQGESDAKDRQGESYERNLTTFIAHIRTIFNAPEMPFIIARVRDHYGKGIQADMVRAAQESVAKTMRRVAWFDTDDCSMFNAGHYDSAGLIVIGKRFAEEYVKMLNVRQSGP